MLVKKFIISILVMYMLSSNISAQQIYTDETQPGSLIYEMIVDVVNQGYPPGQAINFVIKQAIKAEDETLTLKTKSGIAFDIPLAESFYTHMLEEKRLINVAKILIESFPDKTTEIITLSVVLYPDFAQEVINGVAITGIVINEDMLATAMQAGADPNISSHTLNAKDIVINAKLPTPLGAGIGSGGTGSGDTLVSSN